MRFALPAVVDHAISTRHGGVSRVPFATLNVGYSTADEPGNVAENRSRLYESLGIAPDRVVSGWLQHGADVAVFRADSRSEWPATRLVVRDDSPEQRMLFRGDAVVSDVPGLYFALTFADCVPLLFVHPPTGTIGAAHGGWRGTAAGVGPATIRAMLAAFGCDPGELLAAIGPSIGPCCYSVGPEVARTFAQCGQEGVFVERDDACFLDLWESNRQQLVGAGISPQAIEIPRICTACHVDTFYSHRREAGLTGRFLLIAGRSASDG